MFAGQERGGILQRGAIERAIERPLVAAAKGTVRRIIAADVVVIPARVGMLACVKASAHFVQRGDPDVAGKQGVEGATQGVGAPNTKQFAG